MKIIARVILPVILGMSFLTGCGSAGDNQPETPNYDGAGNKGQTQVVDVLVNNQTVTCVMWEHYDAGGMSCDWDKAQ